MGYDDCDKVAMGNLLLFENDKDLHRFLIVGEPVSQKDRSQWGVRTRYLFPVLYDGELRALPTGVRTYKDIGQYRTELGKKAVVMTRHGKRKSMDTTYEVRIEDQSDAEVEARKDVQDTDITALWDEMLIPF